MFIKGPIALAPFILILIELLLMQNGLLSLSTKEQAKHLTKRTDDEFNSNQPIYNQWDKDGNPISNEIDLIGSSNKPNKDEIIQDNNYIKQTDYACGRAHINNRARHKISTAEINNFKLPISRQTKYRPTEIRMPRIIGGDMASPGEFPWTASIKLNEQPICGGSLIDKSWILTAAHCVVGYNPKNLTVRLGAYRIKDLSESHTVDIAVSMFIVHKDYSMPRPFSNDIAMVKLQQPVDYSDYIIPICLPTEDQVSISSSNMIVNDYSNRPNIEHMFDKDDQGGIVISTKMSDTDIAKCFSRLEQNYLNSIGLGSISSSVAAAVATEPSVLSLSSEEPAKMEKHRYSHTYPHVDATSSGYSLSSNSVNDKVYYPNHSSDNKITYITQQFREQQQQQQQQQQQKQHQKLNHYQQIPQIEFDFNLLQNAIQQSSAYQSNSQYVYYALPWASESKRSNLADFIADDISRDNNKIKLSRLPISKELLKEIQSVGSGSMSSLGLGLQHSELINMAGDLNEANVNNDQSNQIKASQNDVSSSRGIFTSFLNKVIRTSTDDEDDEDDPTKYSGLSGIVVGWGWVRELDDEDNSSNNKGYSSITLQKVKLPILRNNVCEAWFQSQSKKITLLPSQFCAGFSSGGKDACRGDSGGPMIIEDNSDTGRYKLIGIVSAGIGCARRSLPGLYTRVASFIPWINAQMLRY